MRTIAIENFKLPESPPFESARWPRTESARADVEKAVETVANGLLADFCIDSEDLPILIERALEIYLKADGEPS